MTTTTHVGVSLYYSPGYLGPLVIVSVLAFVIRLPRRIGSGRTRLLLATLAFLEGRQRLLVQG